MPPLRTTTAVRRAAHTCLLVASGALPLSAQPTPECAAGVIAELRVETRSIYSDEALGQRRFAWVYRLTNRLHVATRPEVIRDEILLEEGDCLDLVLASESARLLRELRFIARAEVTAEPLGPGQWLLRVETWDEWTTSAGINLSIEDELRFEGIFVNEENLLGRGLWG